MEHHPENLPTTAQLRPLVVQAAERLAQQPGVDAVRLQAAMDLVLTAQVRHAPDRDCWLVESGTRTYELTPDCTCADSQHRSRLCKHFLAARLAAHVQHDLAPPRAPEQQGLDALERCRQALEAEAAGDALDEAGVTQAYALAMGGAVTLYPDGRAQVVDGGQRHRVSPTGCTCPHDESFAPCAHSLALRLVRAQVEARAAAYAAQAGEAAVPEAPAGAPPSRDSAPEAAPAAPGGADWPSRCTLNWQDGGVDLLLTLGDTSDEALFQRLKAVMPRIKATVQAERTGRQAAADAAQDAGEPGDPSWCPVHQAAMTRQTNERGAWYSHRTSDGWCKGRA